MLTKPSKIKNIKLYRNRVFVFETVPRKTHDNIVYILTDKKQVVEELIKKPLFKPQFIRSFYIPRIIKAMGKGKIKIKQREYYEEIKEKSGGSIYIAKLQPELYQNKNFYYDMSVELSTINKYTPLKGIRRINYIQDKIDEIIQLTDKLNYQKSYLVVPIIGTENFMTNIKTTMTISDPVLIFLKSLWKGTINLDLYKNMTIIFIEPKSRTVMKLELNDVEEFKKDRLLFFTFLERMNNIALNKESADEIIDDELGRPHVDDEIVEREEILEKIAKKLDIPSTDIEVLTKDEAIVINKINDIVEKYYDSGLRQEELERAIENDSEYIKTVVEYKENKKISKQKENIIKKGLSKEIEKMEEIGDELIVDEQNKLEPEDIPVHNEYIDKRVKKSTLLALDTNYIKKKLNSDIYNILTSFGMTDRYPLILEDYKMEDTSDDFTKKITLYAKYRTDNNKLLNFVIDIPKIVDNRYLFINGSKKTMNKQIVRLPIVKTKPDRVEISTNYNKITIERVGQKVSRKNEYLLKILKRISVENKNKIKIVFGDNSQINAEFSNNFEYEELSSNIDRIENEKYVVSLNRAVMESYIDMLDENIRKKINDNMTPFAYEKDDTRIYVINGEDSNRIYSIDANEMKRTKYEDYADFIIEELLDIKDVKLPVIGKSFIYSRARLLKRNFSILSILGHAYGLETTMRMYDVPYEFSKEKRPRSIEWVEVKFKDGYLYYKDDLKYTMLLNAIYQMNPEEYNFKDFNTIKPYLDHFEQLGYPSYISNTLFHNLDLMIDPISAEVLRDMRMPTDIYRLLLHANTLLVDNTCRQLNDMRNYRIRGLETVIATLYNVMANAVVDYRQARANNASTATINIPRDTLIKELLSNPSINESSMLNPILELSDMTNASAKGLRGINLDQSYNQELRSFHVETQTGIFANETPYSGKAGQVKSLTLNPRIETVRGYIKEADISKIDPTNMFSPIELLSSGYSPTHSDPVRTAMQSGQHKHILAVEDGDPILVGSGVNKVLPWLISDEFAFKAKQNGVVEKIDDENKFIILLYDDGTKDAVDLHGKIIKNSGGGFYLQNILKTDYKEGERFRRGDVIAYNPLYFSADGQINKGSNINYNAGMLAKVAIASADFVFEDACAISESLSSRGASRIVMDKAVALGPNTTILKIKKPGDKVVTGEPLIEFISSFKDAETNAFLDRLFADIEGGEIEREEYSKEEVTSKWTGEVVDVKIYYNVPKEELSPSIQALINEYDNKINKRKKAIKGIKTDTINLPAQGQQNIEKAHGTYFEGILIVFFVEYYDDLSIGDKIIFSTALKGIISKRFSFEESPYSEFRGEDEIIDAIVGPISVFARMVPDVYLQMMSNKALVELKRAVDKIWNGNDKLTMSYQKRRIEESKKRR